MCLQRVIAEVENQAKGVVLILDFKNFSIFQVRQLTPSFGKKLTDLVQVRLQSIFSARRESVFELTNILFSGNVSHSHNGNSRRE